jgi:hypothetical protein
MKCLMLFLCFSAIVYAKVDNDLTRIHLAIPNDNADKIPNARLNDVKVVLDSEFTDRPPHQDLIGFTTYDWQYNGPIYSHCRYDPAANGIHCYWMYSNFNSATDRNQQYNFYDFGTDAWNWSDGIHVYTARSGFGGMDYDPISGCAVTSTQQTISDLLHPVIARDQAPGAGLFEYTQGPAGYQWPAIAVTHNEVIHVIAMSDSLCYLRIGPWGTWSSSFKIYAPYPSYNIAASKTSNKVIILWVSTEDSIRQSAYYKLSVDGGITWDPSTQIPYPPSVGFVPSYSVGSLFATFDNQDNFHIVASVSDTGHTIPAEIWHWCPTNSQPWTLVCHYEAETLNASVGYNAIFADRPSIIQDPTDLSFYVVWERFDTLNYEPQTYLARADIWYARLTNNGQTCNWRQPITMPNTTSKRFPCIGGIKNDTMFIQYLIDSIAGFENMGQGRATKNPVVCHFYRYIPSIEEDISTEKVYNFELSLAIPNPFTSHTVFRYSLPAKSNVSLAIYDATGRLVKNVIIELKDLGVYSVSWNGKDNNGINVKPGIYFAQLKTAQKTITQKIVKTK